MSENKQRFESKIISIVLAKLKLLVRAVIRGVQVNWVNDKDDADVSENF